jgi:16S rRNA (guanine527-N7)-methyltransferase
VTGSALNLLSSALPGLGRPLSADETQKTSNYLEILTKWQKTHRLVGSVDRDWLIRNVVIDSLAFLAHIPHGTRLVADVGSGAGIPGIPIAITQPELGVTLIEGRRRRASFLATVIRELGLANVTSENARVEDLAMSHRDRFDAAVMRCTGAIESILPPVFAIVRPGGVVVATARTGSKAPGAENRRVEMPDGGPREFLRFTKSPDSALGSEQGVVRFT